TNARRHAPGAATDVDLHYTDDTLHLRIRDNGPGPPTTAPLAGHGLLGMRERAAAVGGQLRTGSAAGGGFVVDAVLPAKAELPACPVPRSASASPPIPRSSAPASPTCSTHSPTSTSSPPHPTAPRRCGPAENTSPMSC